MSTKFIKNYSGKKIWKVLNHDINEIQRIAEMYNITIPTAMFLKSRSLINDFNFIKNPKYEYLPDANLIPGTAQAAERILKACQKGENILLFSDYDVDGITSASILFYAINAVKEIMQSTSGSITIKQPHRLREGYGINRSLLNTVNQIKPSIVITLDCGIRDPENILFQIQKKEIDVIVVDHHITEGEELPNVFAIVSPMLSTSQYPYKFLSAGAITLRLVQLLFKSISKLYPKEKEKLLKLFDQMLPLAALSICCDIVPLLGDNFLLAKKGINFINKNLKQCLPGLQALLNVAGIIDDSLNFTRNLSEKELLFYLGPRINAASRIEHAQKAIQLFLTQDMNTARLIANNLNKLNSQRKDIQDDILNEALQILQNLNLQDKYIITLYNEKWHKGIIGIIASKIVELTYRPTIVLTNDSDGLCTGSGRSTPDVSFQDLLSLLNKKYPNLLHKYGGHKFACGLKIYKSDIEFFDKAINDIAFQLYPKEILTPQVKADGLLPLALLHKNFKTVAYEFKELGPYGPEYDSPLFYTPNVKILNLYEKKYNALFFDVIENDTFALPAIAYELPNKQEFCNTTEPIDILFQIEIKDKPYLKIVDWRAPYNSSIKVQLINE